MISERGWYWAAAGVLAFGLSNLAGNSDPGRVRGLTERTLAEWEHVSGRATSYLAMAELMLGRPSSFERAQVAMVRAQTGLAHMPTAIECRRAGNIQLQSERAPKNVLDALPRAILACPRSNAGIKPVRGAVTDDLAI